MVKERDPLEQAKVVIGGGYTSWDNFTEAERESSFRVGLENLEKIDWVPPEYQAHLEEAKSVLRNGMARGLAEYEQKSALFVAMEELEQIEWAPPSDNSSV
jgi:hypothetical protein